MVELPSNDTANRKAPVAREKMFISKKTSKETERPEGRGPADVVSLNPGAVYDDSYGRLVARPMNLGLTKYTHARREKKAKAGSRDHRRRAAWNGSGRRPRGEGLPDPFAGCAPCSERAQKCHTYR